MIGKKKYIWLRAKQMLSAVIVMPDDEYSIA